MIKFPLLCISNGNKIAWLFRARNLLRLEHNIMGKWYREGLTVEEYQKLRAEVQIKWPYKEEKLPLPEWLDYKKERFDLKQEEIDLVLNQLKVLCFDTTKYEPNLDYDIV